MEVDDERAKLAGLGMVGWALSELMFSTLLRRNLIAAEDAQEIIDDLFDAILDSERTGTLPSAACQVARQQVDKLRQMLP